MFPRVQPQSEDAKLNQDLSLIQDNIDKALIPLQNEPLAGGRILKNVSLTAAQDNFISHGLGYVPRLAFAFLPNVDTRIWNPVTASLNGASASNSVINLRCSTSCIVSVWVT